MADLTQATEIGNGWLALPGGNFYNQSTGQIRTTEQMAYQSGIDNPGMFSPQTTSINPAYRSPTMTLDPETGSVTNLTGWADRNNPNNPANQSTTLSGQNGGQLKLDWDARVDPEKVTHYGPTGTSHLIYSDDPNNQQYVTNGNADPRTQQDLMQWLMSQINSPVTSPNGPEAIRSQIAPGTAPFIPSNQNATPVYQQGPASFQNPTPTMGGTMLGSSSTTNPSNFYGNTVAQQAPQGPLSTVPDTSAWRAAPTAYTDLQRGGNGMLSS